MSIDTGHIFDVLTLDLCDTECMDETDRISVSVMVYRFDVKKDIGESRPGSSLALPA